MFNQNFDARVKALQKMQERATKEAVRLNKAALKKWQDFDVASQLRRVEMPEFVLPTQKSCLAKRLLRDKGKVFLGIVLSLVCTGVVAYFYKKKKMEKIWEDSASDRYEFINDEEVSDFEEAGIDALEEVLEQLDEPQADVTEEK